MPLPSPGTRRRPARATPSRLVSLAALLALAPLTQAQNSYDVGMRDGLVTIRANATPAGELAQALGDAAGIAVIVTGAPDTPLTLEIVDEPLAKAIAQLAPNHLLKRESAAADAAILEVTLMMPDVASGGGDSTEFLPSGAPADEVDGSNGAQLVLDANGQPIDPANLRDPGRADAVRAASEATIDPATGLPYDGNGAAGSAIDAAGGSGGAALDGSDVGPAIDPATGLPVQ